MKNIYELEMAQEPEGSNIMIVDSLNLAFRYKHTKRRDFAEDYYRTVKSLAKSYKSDKIILACDYGKSKYRKEIYPEYKADREAKVAQQTEEEKQDFQDFFEDFEKAIDYCKDSFLILKYSGVEADDIAALLTHYILKDYEEDIWLISSDKDWDLLLKDNVHRFSYVTRKEYTLENWHERYEYSHEVALDVKVIAGGKDNVSGVPLIGEKRAHTVINSYGDVFDICASLPLPGKAKYIQNLNEFGKDNLMRNIQLIDKITYCKEAVGYDNVSEIEQRVKSLL
jgi:5'-3' exonuclease